MAGKENVVNQSAAKVSADKNNLKVKASMKKSKSVEKDKTHLANTKSEKVKDELTQLRIQTKKVSSVIEKILYRTKKTTKLSELLEKKLGKQKKLTENGSQKKINRLNAEIEDLKKMHQNMQTKQSNAKNKLQKLVKTINEEAAVI